MPDKPNDAPHPFPPTGNPPPQDVAVPAEGFPKGVTPREVKDREKERRRREHDRLLRYQRTDGYAGDL